jgi:hypothetical protein
MKKLLLLLVFPACAAAQGRPPAPTASLGFNFSYATPDGLISRRAGLSADTALGELSGMKVRLAAEGTHLRSLGPDHFPEELYKAELRLSAEDKKNRLNLNLGSNSDRPFHSPSETDLGFNFSRTFSEKGPHAWLWGLNYSTRRTFLRGMPMPFLGYRYTTDTLTIVAPFMARWQAFKTVSFSASYLPVRNFRLAANWRPRPYFSAELEAGTALEQFLPARRADKGEAFFYETSYLTLKPSLSVSRRLRLTPVLGWQLRGLYYEGSSYDKHHGKKQVGAGPSLGLNVKYDF